MKKCCSCNAEVERLRPVCPNCGGRLFFDAMTPTDYAEWSKTGRTAVEARKHVDRGARLFMQGRYDEAKAEYQKAIQINPLNATAYGNLAHALEKQGKRGEAIPYLEKALELNPHLEGVPEALARLKRLERATRGSAT
ncbi:MAG: tetratricopeptide repeat protein [Planctomycetes bacterium]|nr:tetratricopeptide repeat protein [Planctomycetota bacterium]MBL7039356.1 tetratricopeptide repeat protein [Pirellulaceae bacterium]